MTAKQQLLHFISQQGWTITELLNLLQDEGRISDLVVDFDDLPECDAKRAVEWLKDRKN